MVLRGSSSVERGLLRFHQDVVELNDPYTPKV